MRKISSASHYPQRLEVYTYIGVASGSNLLASFPRYDVTDLRRQNGEYYGA